MTSERDRQLQTFLMELLDDSVSQILVHEDAERFLQWVTHEVIHRGRMEPGLFDSDDEAISLATSFGRGIWNAFPLPGNGFRPQPLATPGRNEACPCGSGRKFKVCCGHGPAPPGLDSGSIWPFLIRKLQGEVLDAAIAGNLIPAAALIGVAMDYKDASRPKLAVKLLEPLFDEPLRHRDEDGEFAFDLLLGLYDDLGWSKKKADRLERIIAIAGRSPLRAGARQRLAAIRMDEGDIAGSWEFFKLAQRDDPNAPSLGLLEVQLLLAQGKPDVASDRARFWVRRLRSLGYPETEGALPVLEQIVHDPGRALGELGIEIAGGAGARLLDWLDRVSDRAVPNYRVTDEPSNIIGDDDRDFETALADRLRELGVADANVSDVIADMDIPDEPAKLPLPESESNYLLAPASVQSMELDWHGVFPLGKPFSVNLLGPDDDIWLPAVEDEWMAYLETNEGAFDSLDILDDLANAVQAHEQSLMTGFEELLLQPLLRRALAIVQSAVSDSARLAWVCMENRPALRCLVNLMFLEERMGNECAMFDIAEQVLALNPDDNHGLRNMIINDRLRRHDDLGAVRLAEEYPADLNPDIAYGHALALFRLARVEEADAAIQGAVSDLPKIPRYLLAKRLRKPKLDPVGVRMGGDDQAWLYRQEMRDVWEATPGAFDWLKVHRPA
jgi:tetratricopeptide (TPR) repeat protein